MRKLLTLVAIAVLTMTAIPALAGGYDETETEIDYCDPATRPGGTGFESWVPKDVHCVTPDVDDVCGAVTGLAVSTIKIVPWANGYGIAFEEAPATFDLNAASFGSITFTEDYNGGSVDVDWYIVGPESGFLVGHGIPNFWDQNPGTITVDTDCEDPEPDPSTTTTMPEETTTEGGVSDSTVTTPSTQPTTTDPGDDVTMSTLPFTGIDDPGSITAVAWSLLTVGGLVLLATRRRGDAEGELEKGE